MRYPFEPAVRQLVALLVRQDYAGVEASSAGERLTAAELREAVSEYGATLVEPPTPEQAPLDVVEIVGTMERSWSVNVPMWSAEEGRSDLTLELTVTERPGGDFALEVDDLHVL